MANLKALTLPCALVTDKDGRSYIAPHKEIR